MICLVVGKTGKVPELQVIAAVKVLQLLLCAIALAC